MPRLAGSRAWIGGRGASARGCEGRSAARRLRGGCRQGLGGCVRLVNGRVASERLKTVGRMGGSRYARTDSTFDMPRPG